MLNLFKRSVSIKKNIDTGRFFHIGRISQGFDEFFDVKKPNEPIITGRGWTLPDVRRKDFDDLHRLWFILYKERNLLLSEKQKAARNTRPVIAAEESRYFKVKRSMAAIKHVLSERSKIDKILKEKDPTFVKLPVKGPLFDERTKFEKHRMRQRKSKNRPRVLIDKRGRVSGTHNPLVVTHK